MPKGRAKPWHQQIFLNGTAEETKRIYGQIVESRFADTRIQIKYEPVGVVAALTPWNFPTILAARKISTALAAGCSVICKPDMVTPGSVMQLVDIVREAGIPAGVVNLLSGDPASHFFSASIIRHCKKNINHRIHQSRKNNFKTSCRKSTKSYDGT